MQNLRFTVANKLPEIRYKIHRKLNRQIATISDQKTIKDFPNLLI